MNTQQLIISEAFYSVQGEGISLGVPAVFLRLAGCNLRCLGFSYQDPDSGEHLGCDSKHVWKTGVKKSFAALLEDWDQQGYLAHLTQGAHLIITGGEPLIQQAALIQFIAELDAKLSNQVYIEIETNGTFLLSERLLSRLNQINVSPKLPSSGEPREKTYIPAVLKQLAAIAKTQFKFVVQHETDLVEIVDYYVHSLKIPRRRVLLMPEGGQKAQLAERAERVIEWCKREHFRYTPRLQVEVWDEVVGV